MLCGIFRGNENLMSDQFSGEPALYDGPESDNVGEDAWRKR